MPRYPESFIELVRERADLLELVGRQVNLKKQGANWMGLCPFHQEKTPSFSLRPERGFMCFGCGASGDAFGFLMKLKGIGFSEAVEELAAMSGIPLPPMEREDPEEERRRETRQRLLDLLVAAREFYREQLSAPTGEPARRYLRERGVKPETVQRFGLGFAPVGWSRLLDRFGGGEAAGELLEQAGLVTRKSPGERLHDRFRNRLLFPIADIKGRCVAFGGRLLGPGEPKYLNSPETELFQKGRLLYGLDMAQEAIQKEGGALVVEGYMDRLALAEYGIEHAVATLGTALTADHLRLLWQRTRRLTFCFDGDAAGEKAAWRALELVLDGLEADRHVAFLFLPRGEDPDQVVRREGAEGFRGRLKTGISPIEFLIRQLGSGLEAHTPEGRAALVHRARPLLNKVKDPLLKELYADTLSQRLHIPLHYARGTVRPASLAPPVSAPRKPAPAFRAVPADGSSYRPDLTQRDHEQVLLSLVLRQPRLVREREEELSRLRLENTQLSELLTELIEMGQRMAELPAVWSPEGFSSPELARRARRILAVEAMGADPGDREFDGCLVSIHLKGLRREIDRLLRRIELEGDPDASLFMRCRALKEEVRRVLEEKRANPGPPH